MNSVTEIITSGATADKVLIGREPALNNSLPPILDHPNGELWPALFEKAFAQLSPILTPYRYDDDDGNQTIRLILQVKGKTGIREVVCNKGTEVFFERLYDYRKEELNAHPSPDTFIFCHQDGKPIVTMRKSFENLLDDLKLRTNSQGRNRTLYSLRHMYATFRLSEEVPPFLLAKQMGTSVEMLEEHYGQVVNRLVATQITKTRSRQTTKVSDQVYPF